MKIRSIDSDEDVAEHNDRQRFMTPLDMVPKVDAQARSMITHGPGVPVDLLFLAILEHCSVELVVPLLLSQHLLDGSVAGQLQLLPFDAQRRLSADTRRHMSDLLRAELGAPA